MANFLPPCRWSTGTHKYIFGFFLSIIPAKALFVWIKLFTQSTYYLSKLEYICLSTDGHSYKPFIWVKGSRPHQIRPQSKESKSENTRKTGKMMKRNCYLPTHFTCSPRWITCECFFNSLKKLHNCITTTIKYCFIAT